MGYGREYSYRWTAFGTGIYWLRPRSCTAHKFRESVVLGETSLGIQGVQSIICDLEKDWRGRKYEILKNNCCHFCSTFSERLGVEPVPLWVTSLAGVGDDMRSAVRAPFSCVAMKTSTQDATERTMKSFAREPPPRVALNEYEQLRVHDRHGPLDVWGRLPGNSFAIGCAICILWAVVLFICCTGILLWRRYWYFHLTQSLRHHASFPAEQLQVTTSDRIFDCQASFAGWKLRWPPEQQRWCCVHAGRACPR